MTDKLIKEIAGLLKKNNLYTGSSVFIALTALIISIIAICR